MHLIERLDAVRARWDVLAHPFYRRWERGDLSRAEIAYYAGEYRHVVIALADTAAAAGDPEHAREEAAHIVLWRDFAHTFDASLDRAPREETAACADAWRRTDPLEARAVLYAVESAQPAISRTKLDGLIRYYGVEAGSPATSYFTVHASLDTEHAAASQAVLEVQSHLEDVEPLVTAAEAALKGNWRLLDGVVAAFN